jgi:hypothetical protein
MKQKKYSVVTKHIKKISVGVIFLLFSVPSVE